MKTKAEGRQAGEGRKQWTCARPKKASLLLCLCVGLLPAVCLGQTTTTSTVDSTREEMQQHHAEQQAQALSLFGPPPVGHVVPRRDRITISAEVQYHDLTVAPPGKDISEDRSTLKNRLDVKGYSAVPYVVFSADRFGVGFAAEAGNIKLSYLNQYTMSNSDYRQLQEGKVTYSGVGLYVYYIPKLSFMPKFFTSNFVLGGKQLNTVHEVRQTYRISDTTPFQKHRYAVKKYDLGFDVGLNLVKNFTVLPWMNYTFLRINDAETQSQIFYNGYVPPSDQVLLADRTFLWLSQPKFKYGIDFAVRLANRTDIHLGGLLGAIGNLVKGSDRIYDNSLNLSVSVELK